MPTPRGLKDSSRYIGAFNSLSEMPPAESFPFHFANVVGVGMVTSNGTAWLDRAAELAAMGMGKEGFSGRFTLKQGTAETMGAAANSTYFAPLYCDRKFYAVRLCVYNSTLSAIPIPTMKVAAVPTARHDGTGLVWADVTFPGGATTCPAATGTTGADRTPGTIWSDWIPLTALERSDIVGAPYSILVGGYNAAIQSTTQTGLCVAGAAPYVRDRGYDYYYKLLAGDNITTIPTLTGYSGASCISPVCGAEFLTGGDTLAVYAFGDSLTAGNLSIGSGAQGGWPNELSYLWRANGQATLSNWGVSTQKHGRSLDILKSVCSINKPDVAIFSAGSPNDLVATQAHWDAFWQRDLETIAWCRGQGIRPIITTMFPVNAFDATTDAYRRALNDRVRNDAPCKVWDFAAVLGNGGTPEDINPLFAMGDGLHINQSGNFALAEYAALRGL